MGVGKVLADGVDDVLWGGGCADCRAGSVQRLLLGQGGSSYHAPQAPGSYARNQYYCYLIPGHRPGLQNGVVEYLVDDARDQSYQCPVENRRCTDLACDPYGHGNCYQHVQEVIAFQAKVRAVYYVLDRI